MIENMFLANEGSYDSSGASLSCLKQLNFIYGSNGAGKTTISRVIENDKISPDCKVSWENGVQLETLVYNRDFVERHFDVESTIKGIYTFGGNKEIADKIKDLKLEHEKANQSLIKLQNTLGGEEAELGKENELKQYDVDFTKNIWTEKKKFNDLKDAFQPYNNNASKFKECYLEMAQKNCAKLKDISELRSTAETVFADDLIKKIEILKPRNSEFSNYESHVILSKKIIGKDDVDIASLINKLSNSDWVQRGRKYLEDTEDICPFCQQTIQDGLKKDLDSYFDTAYINDINLLDQLFDTYQEKSNNIIKEYEDIATRNHDLLDQAAFQKDINMLSATLEANIAEIENKIKYPSIEVSLKQSASLFSSLEMQLDAANKKIQQNNDILKNVNTRRIELKEQVWRFFLEETKTIFSTYQNNSEKLRKAIVGLNENISKKENELNKIDTKIKNLEREITSIKPTIDDINKLLESFGYRNFKLIESRENGFYEIQRLNGEDAKKTLSEGEKSFITFLYFYFLIKGSFNTSGTTDDKIVVFDDPVSSLDSDVLFIVCNLISNVMNEMIKDNCSVKQLFILTHNIYFHKEITFQKEKKAAGLGKLTHGYWVIRKCLENSKIDQHKKNPVKSSYDLLWQEVKRENPSSTVIQNVLRRILEHYFKFLGGIDNTEIINSFEGNEKVICSSLFSWINDGSHSTSDELFMSCSEEQVQKYLCVFQKVFEQYGHGEHYKMMMKDSYVPLTEQEGANSEEDTSLTSAIV